MLSPSHLSRGGIDLAKLESLDPVQDDSLGVIWMAGGNNLLRQQAPVSKRYRRILIAIQGILHTAFLTGQEMIGADVLSTTGDSDGLCVHAVYYVTEAGS